MKTFIQNTVSKIFFVCSFFYYLNTQAQAPNAMSYQAVIRNASNVLVANQGIGMRVSILQGTATGTEVYKELFNPNPVTNVNGLVSLAIGTGIPLTGTFGAINWSTGLYFVKTETDPTGGTNYTVVATSQLLSVPFALNVTPDIHISSLSCSTTTAASGTETLLKWTALEENTTSASGYNATTGEYTIPVTGYYSVFVHVGWNSLAASANGIVFATIYVNGNLLRRGYSNDSVLGAYPSDSHCQVEKRFVAGDKIKFYEFQGTTGNMTISSLSTNFGIHLIHQ